MHVRHLVVVLVYSNAVLIHSVGSGSPDRGLEVWILAPETLIVAFVWSSPHNLVNHIVKHKQSVLPPVELVLLRLQREKQILVLFQTLEALGRGNCLFFVVGFKARAGTRSGSITVAAATPTSQRLLRIQQRFFLLFVP